MSLVTSSVVGSVAASVATAELHGLPLFIDTVKVIFTEAPMSFFVKAGLFVGVSAATAYFIISRIRRMRKMQEMAEEEANHEGSPLLFERDDISPVERNLGVDNFVHDENKVEELDEIMDELRKSGSILYGHNSPKRPARSGGKKKSGKKKGKKAKKHATRRYLYGRNMSEDVRMAGRAELKRWYELFGTDNFDIHRVDQAARDLGIFPDGHDDDDDGDNEDAA